jgi:copper chaperone CopZ
MTHQYAFRVEDVTCEKCDARIKNALAALPGVQTIDYVRTPENEAQVRCVSTEALSSQQIEESIVQQSAGTTHQYRVRWDRT